MNAPPPSSPSPAPPPPSILDPERAPAFTPGLSSTLFASLLALALIGACVAAPLALAAARIFTSIQAHGLPPSATVAWSLLSLSLAWALAIGLGATLLAWPVAWLLRASPFPWLRGVMAAPLLLPTYLTYTAYGLARAPGTLLGNLIESQVAHGWQELPIYAGRAVAGVGLTLWAWPLALLVLLPSVLRVPRAALESLALERVGPVRALWLRAGACKGGLLGALGIVSLVMLGSAVPLHLSQAPTYAVKVWMDLTLNPGRTDGWVGAWPLVAIALLSGGILTWRVSAWLNQGASPDESGQGSPNHHAPHPLRRTAGWAIWLASTVLPLVLLAGSLRTAQPLVQFWSLTGEAVVTSGLVALGVGGAMAVLTLCFWKLADAGRGARPVHAVCLFLLLIGALMPGILVGSMVAQAAQRVGLQDSPLALCAGHIARFGFLAALAGTWLASMESRSLREARVTEGVGGVFGYLQLMLPPHARLLGGVWLAGAALSLHEIEASIMLQPPGLASLAQTMLGYLHFARMEELSAAAVWLVGGVLVLSVLAGLGGAWSAGRNRRMRNVKTPER